MASQNYAYYYENDAGREPSGAYDNYPQHQQMAYAYAYGDQGGFYDAGPYAGGGRPPQQEQMRQQPDMRQYDRSPNAYNYPAEPQPSQAYSPQYQQQYQQQQQLPPRAARQQQQQQPRYQQQPSPLPPPVAANIFAPATTATATTAASSSPPVLKTLLTRTAKQPYQMLADYSPSGSGGGGTKGGGGGGGGGKRDSTSNLLNKAEAGGKKGRANRRGAGCCGRYCGCCMACVPGTRRGKIACGTMIVLLLAGLALAGFFLFPRMPDITVKSFRIDAATGDAASAATVVLPSKTNNNTFKLALPVVMKVEAVSTNPYKIKVSQLNVSAFVNTADAPRQPIGVGGEKNIMIASKGLTKFTLNFTIEYTQNMGLIGILTDPALNQFLASCNISAFSTTAVQGQATKIDYSTDVTVFPLSNLGIVPNLAGTFGFPCPFGGTFLKGLQDVAAGLKNGTVGTATLSKKVKALLGQTALGSSLLKDFDLDAILKSAGL
ncbi:hypothetical protein BDZ88DRAFT_488034 [Geranomyces variabilis]|nr:hypothetical protein BDZ88DRAFT_488034 [Geranomyces variabilis]KAJ3137107.1 hypothetical protein HDU90_002278 [Geranomyces variabilis]